MSLNVIYHCNEWKERSSFRLIGVVEEDELDEAVMNIKSTLGYNDEELEKYIYIDSVNLNELDM